MQGLSSKLTRTAAYWFCASALAASTTVFAQGTQPVAPTPDSTQQIAPDNSGGWPTVNNNGTQDQGGQAAPNDQTGPASPNQPPMYPQAGQQPNYPPANHPRPNYPQPSYPAQTQGGPQPGYQQPAYGGYPQQQYPQQPYPQQAPPPVPAQLTIPQGTFVTVRVNQRLSSDHSQKGDTFTASLVEPVVVNGIVVAEPGETIGGVVVDAEKGGTQKLVIQLTDLTLVDGQRIPLQTQLIARKGTGRNGQDAGTIVGTTGFGALVGAVAGGGPGAAVGATAGLFVGALVTHDHPSVVYPEQVLTFQVQTPVSFSTQNSPIAFRYVEPGEYDRPTYAYGAPAQQPGPAYYAGYPYPYYYPFWGPSLGFTFWGGGYYRRPVYYPGRFYGPGHGGVIHGGVVRGGFGVRR